MRLDLSGVIISGQRLEKMVDFLFKISDRVELISSDYKEMTKQEYETAEKDYINGLTDEEIDEINNGRAEEEADLSDLSEDERQEELELRRKVGEAREKEIFIRESSFIKSEDEIIAIVNEKFRGLGCLQREVTCKTHCTLGGAAVVYSLPVSGKLKEYFLKMELLTWPLKSEDGKILADDPAFYYRGNRVCSICSHEGYITLDLNKEQEKQFYALGIPYYLVENAKEKPTFPFLKETVCVFPLSGTITTLLGQGLFDFNMDTSQEYLKFYQWFDEHADKIRKEIRPCSKSMKEIVEYLQQKYTLEPYHSEAIELQCQRHGWDDFYAKPLNADCEITREDGVIDKYNISEYMIPKLVPFLYRMNYKGEELIVGGEYKSDYLFADTIGTEEKLKNLVENIDEKVCGFTQQGSLSEPLFQLLREINIVRGIDEYEKYDSFYFRTYIQILKYDDFKNQMLKE
ncbi:MAG: hypothetical protein WCD89_27405 [Anaerocolumna sp.]